MRKSRSRHIDKEHIATNITSDTSGIDVLRKRIEEAEKALPSLLQEAAHKSGETVAGWLKDKAPHSNSGGAPPPGDASGTLAGSFHVVDKGQASIEVQTTQPLKLQYVTKGTGTYIGKGRIYPTTKRALYWSGAAHPVRSIAGQRANDFVSPVLTKVNDAIEPEMQKVVDKLNSIMGGV